MSTVKYTIDDFNPMIVYEPSSAWRPGNKTADPEASKQVNSIYSNNGTFTLCQQYGAMATFKFNGTGVGIYGTKRSNYGTYTATLDGIINRFNGYSQNSIYNQALFESSSLQNGAHILVLTKTQNNSSLNFLDVDYEKTRGSHMNRPMPGPRKQISTGSKIRVASDSLLLSVLRVTKPCSALSRTTQANASVTLTFNGEEVRIYGFIGPNVSPYLVQWDSFSGVMLYQTSDLGLGKYTVTLMNTPNNTAESLSIAYTVVTDNTTDMSSDASSLSTGAIAGVVVGAAVGLAALALIIFFWRRGRKDNNSERLSLDVSSCGCPDGRNGTIRFSLEGLATTSKFSDTNSTSPTNPWSSHPSSSADGPGRRNPSVAPLMPHHPILSHRRHNPSCSQGQPTVFPASANQSMQHLPAEELRSTRMFVEGREQNFGPVPTTDDVLLLNYDQAIEPFRQRS
ncbi:hypothetical protein DFS33DRAFT_1272690 [Desarmillaria ectypa]|nr:hypothetical protein DFS33DRAFT_1272690 [Desarmillaria ectypa]